MKLEQSFEVAAPLEQVWQTLIDVEHVAPCLPGAAVTGRNEDGSYNGTFTVKIGPTTASYTGKLEMENIDEASHTATMQAQGTDKRGQGGAKATILSRLAPADGPRHPRRGRHRLPHHRAARAVRARRDDRGHLRASAEGVRQAASEFAGGAAGDVGGAGAGRRSRCGGRARAASSEPAAPRARAVHRARGPPEPAPLRQHAARTSPRRTEPVEPAPPEPRPRRPTRGLAGARAAHAGGAADRAARGAHRGRAAGRGRGGRAHRGRAAGSGAAHRTPRRHRPPVPPPAPADRHRRPATATATGRQRARRSRTPRCRASRCRACR